VEHCWATGELQTAILASWMSTHSLILMRRVKDGTNNVIARKINQTSGRVNLQTTSKKKTGFETPLSNIKINLVFTLANFFLNGNCCIIEL